MEVSSHHILMFGDSVVSSRSCFNLIVRENNYADGSNNIIIGKNIICKGIITSS